MPQGEDLKRMVEDRLGVRLPGFVGGGKMKMKKDA